MWERFVFRWWNILRENWKYQELSDWIDKKYIAQSFPHYIIFMTFEQKKGHLIRVFVELLNLNFITIYIHTCVSMNYIITVFNNIILLLPYTYIYINSVGRKENCFSYLHIFNYSFRMLETDEELCFRFR